jgi:hypothetical protein
MNPIDPLNGMIRQAERMDRMLQEMDRVNRVDQMCRELRFQDEIARCAQPPCTTQELIERATRPFNSLIESQETLSRLMKGVVVTPPPALTFQDISPSAIMPEDPMQWVNDIRIPVERIETDLPQFQLPDLPESRSLAELQQMSDNEIRTFLDGNISINTVQMALRILAMRHLERATRPHWSVTWTFWLVVASVIIGAIGVMLMLRWFKIRAAEHSVAPYTYQTGSGRSSRIDRGMVSHVVWSPIEPWKEGFQCGSSA